MEIDPRHRLRWWLHAERALGLGFVIRPENSQSSAEVSVGFPYSEGTRTIAPRFNSTESEAETEERGREIFSNRVHPSGVEALSKTTRTPTPNAGSAENDLIARPEPFRAGTSSGQVLIGSIGTVGPINDAELPADEKVAALLALDSDHVKGCTKCNLCRTRRNTVFGEGDASAKLMFVGEGPGYTEDATGKPFVGRAGQKLTEMISAMKLSRDQVYICNVVKCRAFLAGPPAKDRPPMPEEVAACMPYLSRQIEIVRPRVIVTLGLSATQSLLAVKQSMSRLRGQWQSWRGIKVMPTFHPSYILRNPTVETRRAVWDDLKLVMQELSQPAQS